MSHGLRWASRGSGNRHDQGCGMRVERGHAAFWVGRDLVKYLVPNFIFPMELAEVLRRSKSGHWKLSRMKECAGDLPIVGLSVSSALCLTLLLLGLKHHITIWTKSNTFLKLVAALIFRNSAVASLFKGMESYVG